MARVTVEDCVDKVTNRFELVLLATHRARSIGKGSQITVDREDDKDGVIALREIAEKTISPGDIREWLIHSIQRNIEIEAVDEREPTATPTIRRNPHPGLGHDVQSTDTIVDVITEDQLLRGMQKLLPDVSGHGGD